VGTIGLVASVPIPTALAAVVVVVVADLGPAREARLGRGHARRSNVPR
jgi:hypothetical protein